MEDCFAEAKNETGLDRHQAPKYRAWYRRIALSWSRKRSSPPPAHAMRPVPPESPPASANAASGTSKKGF